MSALPDSRQCVATHVLIVFPLLFVRATFSALHPWDALRISSQSRAAPACFLMPLTESFTSGLRRAQLVLLRDLVTINPVLPLVPLKTPLVISLWTKISHFQISKGANKQIFSLKRFFFSFSIHWHEL